MKEGGKQETLVSGKYLFVLVNILSTYTNIFSETIARKVLVQKEIVVLCTWDVVYGQCVCDMFKCGL